MSQANKQLFPLSDQHLLQLAKDINSRWEDVFRQGLTTANEDLNSNSNSKLNNTAACLPKSQLEICRKLAPNDSLLQAYFVLARWRWFCASVGCSNKQALLALTNAVKACGLTTASGNLQAMNNVSTSLEYV
ncbi:unnamed protein product [Trichobilharzia regenti]|nr:unnamed protein product [Trichobilharzia regenti]